MRCGFKPLVCGTYDIMLDCIKSRLKLDYDTNLPYKVQHYVVDE